MFGFVRAGLIGSLMTLATLKARPTSANEGTLKHCSVRQVVDLQGLAEFLHQSGFERDFIHSWTLVPASTSHLSADLPVWCSPPYQEHGK